MIHMNMEVTLHSLLVRPCDEYLDLDFRGSMTFVLIQIVIAVVDVFRFERCDYRTVACLLGF
jgi:hypothetical protein